MLKIFYHTRGFILALCILLFLFCEAQPNSSQPSHITKAAGPQYKRSALHQWLWGRHYRKEWSTPARLPFFYLDTAAGGLTVYQRGGGRQTRTLRIASANSKEFVLRSIDKTFGEALPEIYRNTFVEKIFNDQVSIAHPYAAVTVAPMAEIAKIYHTRPRIVYLPEQRAMDSFNAGYANQAYLFEQRPDGNWEEAENFGNSKDIIGTDELLERLQEDAGHKVDQAMYVRSRLFDMFIGDWGRHEDQWRWASFEKEDHIFYRPIPRDRDQVYTKFDGVLVKLGRSAAGIGHLQHFDYDIKNVPEYNFPARHLDRRLTNQTTLDQWTTTAKELQQLLTDSVITNSVKLLPPEVYPISGKEITAKLISRRNHLIRYAEEYYRFLSEEVEIVGTKEKDRFDVTATPDGSVVVRVENEKGKPFYQRTFMPAETKEIRLYGLNSEDVYDIKGERSPINVRIISGPQEDHHQIQAGSKVHIYDTVTDSIEPTKGVRLHLADTADKGYDYTAFKFDKKGFSPSIFYSREDRLYAGLSYKKTNQRWRKEPFASRHELFVRYSITQTAFNVGYEGVWTEAIGKWNILLDLNYDWERWTNFFGLGNETRQPVDEIEYYRIRRQDGLGGISLNRLIGKQSSITISPFYETVKLLRDNDRFLVKEFPPNTNNFRRQHFAGARMVVDLRRWNDMLLQTKGIQFSAGAGYTRNIREERQFVNYGATFGFAFPIFKNLIVSVTNGAATVDGEPEFYQLNNIGGNRLRGYRRERYWGQTIFHNNNELQLLFDVKSNLFNGKLGLVGFYDQGRVWLKGEGSDTWHNGVGGGFIIAPFNKAYISVVMGVSKDDKRIHLNFRRPLR